MNHRVTPLALLSGEAVTLLRLACCGAMILATSFPQRCSR